MEDALSGWTSGLGATHAAIPFLPSIRLAHMSTMSTMSTMSAMMQQLLCSLPLPIPTASRSVRDGQIWASSTALGGTRDGLPVQFRAEFNWETP